MLLRYALLCIIIALVAAIFGLGGIEGTALYVAKILLFVFVVMLIISFLSGRKPKV